MKSRTTLINIIYEGTDITKDLAPYLLSFSFTDNAHGKADDISLTLQDSSGEWLRDWTPAKSDTITASIIKQSSSRSISLPCGSFSIDQIEYSMPPNTLTIKAVSSDIKKHQASQLKTRAWENITLREILEQVTAENSLALFLDTQSDGVISRIEQTEQSDLEFLKELCADYGLAVKIQKDRAVIYDIEEYESKPPVLEIWSDDARIISARFTSKSAQVYKKAVVKYHDPVKNEYYEEEYEDDSEEGSERELIIHERVESQGDAKRLAEQRLTSANRKEITGSITLTGSPELCAGVNIQLGGFGMFSGKHFITKASHKIDSSGYTTALELGQPEASKSAGKTRKASRKSTGGTQGEIFYEGERYYGKS